MASGGPFREPKLHSGLTVACSCGWSLSIPERHGCASPTLLMNQWERHWRVAHGQV